MSFIRITLVARTALALVTAQLCAAKDVSGQTAKPESSPMIFRSGETQTHLVELYTSEGCSSCPPAEDWLNQLQSDTGLWKDFIPVAFHVDYWDGLGWPDKFASEQYTARQRAYAHQWRSDSIYTPGFVLDGKEWQVWFSKRKIPAPSAKKAGMLVAAAAGKGTWNITYAPAEAKTKQWEVYLALLGGNYKVPVKAGENRGRNLTHDFVVLELVKAPMVLNQTGYHSQVSLKRVKPEDSPQAALAVWICAADDLTPVQATGGWLSRGSP